MTVALGLVCSDGALLAADSMGIQGRLASPIIKVRAFQSVPALWTFAGSGFVAQIVEESLAELDVAWSAREDRHWHQPRPHEIKRELTERLGPVIRDAYESIVTPPGERDSHHATEFMFAGWGRDGGFLIRLHADLAISVEVEPLAAIGYGHEYAAVARALMSHHLEQEPTLHQGKLLAHRTITTVCDVSSGGVGLPVQMGVVDQSGARILSADEVDVVALAVDRWKELERDSLVMQRPDDFDVARDLPDFSP